MTNQNKEILQELKTKGYIIIKNVFTENEILAMKYEMLGYYNQMPDGAELGDSGTIEENGYPYGKHCRFPNFSRLPATQQIFSNKNLSEVTKGYLGDNCKENMQIFASYEYKTEEQAVGKPRNAFWHFDPYYALKYFIYLQDTNIENGCTRLIPNTKHLTEKIRNEKTFADICDQGYNVEHLVNEDSVVVDVEVKSTDLMIFDTDLFHIGSNIKKEGLERMVIIIHNRP
jgi:hypothetical protein